MTTREATIFDPPSQPRYSPLFGLLANAVVGLIFISTALSKAAAPRETQFALEHVAGDEPLIVSGLLIALIAFELALGAFLLFGAYIRASRALAITALLLFCGWLGYLIVFDVEISCGCGLGSTWLVSDDARQAGIARNASMILLLCSAMWLDTNPLWKGRER